MQTMTPATLALLVRMKDGREYLVPQENLLHLIEFAKTFSAEIYRVSVQSGVASILNLGDLASAVCEMNYRLRASYTELGRVMPLGDVGTIEHEVETPKPVVITKNLLRERNRFLKSQIREKLLAGETVTINDLMNEFADEDFPRTKMISHLSSVRAKLATEGHTVSRTGVGSYRIMNEIGLRRSRWGSPSGFNWDEVAFPPVVPTLTTNATTDVTTTDMPIFAPVNDLNQIITEAIDQEILDDLHTALAAGM